MWSGAASNGGPATETLGSPPGSAGAARAARRAALALVSAGRGAGPGRAAPQRTWPGQSPPVGGRPDGRPAPPPPAAGQGGKLPLVSRSAVIAALAAVAALVILYLLHGAG